MLEIFGINTDRLTNTSVRFSVKPKLVHIQDCICQLHLILQYTSIPCNKICTLFHMISEYNVRNTNWIIDLKRKPSKYFYLNKIRTNRNNLRKTIIIITFQENMLIGIYVFNFPHILKLASFSIANTFCVRILKDLNSYFFTTLSHSPAGVILQKVTNV